MSISNPIEIDIDYPESDGRPMGETDTHRRWIVRIDELLKQRLSGQRVYIGSDLLVYYQCGQPRRFVVPDNFVVLDCEPGPRRTFKTWEEKRTPDVVFEVTSRSTKRDDWVFKPKIYEQFGVSEYFIYDPLADYLHPSIQGFRLKNDVMVPMESVNGELVCQTLGIRLRLVGQVLEMLDVATGERLLTEAEANRKLAEQQRELAQQERAARELAESKNRQLEEEIKRLRSEGGLPSSQ